MYNENDNHNDDINDNKKTNTIIGSKEQSCKLHQPCFTRCSSSVSSQIL